MHRLKVSSNGRFLVTSDGKPFFWLGDTAWELFHRCASEDATHYLDNRQRLGFNVIQATVLAETDGLHTPNAYGDVPFLYDDPTRPVESYFVYIDTIIELAKQRGLYIGLLPVWGDKVTPEWGIIFNKDNARPYGAWIGRRYRDVDNIIWILGGDRPALKGTADWRPIWNAMAEGIRAEAGDDILMSFHPPGGADGTGILHKEKWLDFHMLQSGHVPRDSVTWEMISNLYQLELPKPVLDDEPCYEDHPIDPFLRRWEPAFGCFTDYDVRKQAYRAVFAGGCGHTYGHHSVWQFYTADRAPINFPQCIWQQAIERPGAAQMRHLKGLMLSRPYLKRIPDQSLILSDSSTRGAHIRATRDSEGQYVLVCMP